MKLEEIKNKYSMLDILARYNIKVTRGFCQCPFHKGDHTPSMKVYKDGFYCFGCGAGGDFIKFVQLHDKLNFEEACKWIAGEELDKKTNYLLSVARVRRKETSHIQSKNKKRLEDMKLSELWQTFLTSNPLSDEWCDSYNRWQKLVYAQEQLMEKLREK